MCPWGGDNLRLRWLSGDGKAQRGGWAGVIHSSDNEELGLSGPPKAFKALVWALGAKQQTHPLRGNAGAPPLRAPSVVHGEGPLEAKRVV